MLEGRADDHAGDLSGGQQQQLALAMALLGEPDVLLIDELSLGLAPVVVAQLLDELRALRDRGTTIVIVEQSVNVALGVADHAYFMEKGAIRFSGPARELLQQPDLVKAIYLQGASEALSGGPAATTTLTPTPTSGRRGPGASPSPHALETRGLSAHFGGTKVCNKCNSALLE